MSELLEKERRMSAQEYFNREQTCRYLGICETTLRDWEGRRGFPSPGRNGRWKRSTIDRYMAGDDIAPADVSSPPIDRGERAYNASKNFRFKDVH